jgi:hypothetical protein
MMNWIVDNYTSTQATFVMLLMNLKLGKLCNYYYFLFTLFEFYMQIFGVNRKNPGSVLLYYDLHFIYIAY